MKLIDTHTHLYLEEFDSDRIESIIRAIEQDVELMLLPNVDSATIDGMMAINNSFPNNCPMMIGIHPCSVKENYEDELQIVEKYLQSHKFVAVGEIGIDLYWDKTFVNEQVIALKRQIEMAIQHNLPIVIHSRNANEEIFDVLQEFANQKLSGVFHCFSGNVAQANRAVEMGFLLGIGGVVTYKNSGLDKVVSNIDLSHLVLETDSPYLSPVPFRGKRNESAYIKHVANRISEIKQIPIEKVCEITTENAKRVFKL